MPLLTRWFVKTSMVYLILALVVGVWQQLPGQLSLAGLFPVYLHLLTFGWLTQLIFGVAYWMFPKFSPANFRGYDWLEWLTYYALNAGLVLRAVFEPWNQNAPSALSGWMLALAALLQWLAGVGFLANTWPRVKEK